MRILFIHGRAQGGKRKHELRQKWIDALTKGLRAAGRQLPPGTEIDFPYYGDALDRFVHASDAPLASDVAEKGTGGEDPLAQFMRSALLEIYRTSPRVTEATVEAELEAGQPTAKDPQNWWFVRAVARAIDNLFPAVTEWTIETFLRDVYLYLNSPVVRRGIDDIVREKLTSQPTVIVSHSLGTVVGYRLLCDQQGQVEFTKHITLGSPLGISAISAQLGRLENPALNGWYNAYDPQDIVALHPLDDEYFRTWPAIVNAGHVRNDTPNQHGIAGYLNDRRAAIQIADSLRE